MVNGIGAPFRLPVGFRYPEALAPSWSPDGSLLAWICSFNQVGAGGNAFGGYQLNQGALCYANRGDLIANTVTVVDTSVDSIFPPAWVSYPHGDGIGFAIIYSDGGRLMYYDLVSNAVPAVVADLPTGSDMPVIINHWTGNSYLFYRYDNNGVDELRVALLENGNTYTVGANGVSFTSFGAVGSAVHQVVAGTTGVQYYDVSQFLDIMLYTDLAGFNTTNVYFSAAPTATPDLATDVWAAAAEPHDVDGSVGNPTQSSDGFGVWNGNMNVPTFLHAHRVTFDWVP
jgi:hypothetical protein